MSLLFIDYSNKVITIFLFKLFVRIHLIDFPDLQYFVVFYSPYWTGHMLVK